VFCVHLAEEINYMDKMYGPPIINTTALEKT